MSCGMTAPKSAKSDGNETKIVTRLPNVVNGSVAAGPAAAASEAARPCNAWGTAEKACCIVDMALCTSPADVPVAWLTAAAWLAVDAGSVFCCGCWNGDSVD